MTTNTTEPAMLATLETFGDVAAFRLERLTKSIDGYNDAKTKALFDPSDRNRERARICDFLLRSELRQVPHNAVDFNGFRYETDGDDLFISPIAKVRAHRVSRAMPPRENERPRLARSLAGYQEGLELEKEGE